MPALADLFPRKPAVYTLTQLAAIAPAMAAGDVGAVAFCSDAVWSGGTGCLVQWNGSVWRDPDGNTASSSKKSVPVPVFTVAALPNLSGADEGAFAIASDLRSGASSNGGLVRWSGSAWFDMFGNPASTEFEARANNTGSLSTILVNNTNLFIKFCTLTFTAASKNTNTFSFMNAPISGSNFALKNYGLLLFAVDVSDMNVSPTVQLELVSFSELLKERFVAVITTDTPSLKVIELYYANAAASGTNRLAFEVVQAYRQTANTTTVVHSLTSETPPSSQASLPSGVQVACTYSPLRGLEYYVGAGSSLAIGSDGKLYYSGADTDGRYVLANTFTESVQDIVGAFIADSASLDATYDDAANTYSLVVIPDSTTQRLEVARNSGAFIAARKQINFIEGANTSLAVTDDAANNRVNVVITSSAGTGLTHAQAMSRTSLGF